MCHPALLCPAMRTTVKYSITVSSRAAQLVRMLKESGEARNNSHAFELCLLRECRRLKMLTDAEARRLEALAAGRGTEG